MPKKSLDASKVAVYNFRDFTRGIEMAEVAPFKATRQAIQDMYRGKPIQGTEELVSPDDLDELGRYRRMPTGWGELGSR